MQDAQLYWHCQRGPVSVMRRNGIKRRPSRSSYRSRPSRLPTAVPLAGLHPNGSLTVLPPGRVAAAEDSPDQDVEDRHHRVGDLLRSPGEERPESRGSRKKACTALTAWAIVAGVRAVSTPCSNTTLPAGCSSQRTNLARWSTSTPANEMPCPSRNSTNARGS